jgi:hypothetical protein
MPKSKKKPAGAPAAMTIAEAGEYWDTHSLLDEKGVKEVYFDVDIQSVKYYYAVEKELVKKLSAIAKAKGISPQALLNRWIKERIA